MQKVNVGIIGCGRIAMGKHLPNLRANPHVSLKAFHNRTRAKAEKARDTFGDKDAKVFDDPYELIQDNALDAIHILTANDTHHVYTVAALKAGKHVMCEKPMASTQDEAKAMHEAMKRSEKVLSVAFQNRHRADVKWLKEFIDAGKLGTIYHVKARSVRRRGIPTWGAFTRKNQGGGPLADIGSHALDLALYFTGFHAPEHVLGSTYQKLAGKPTHANRFGIWNPAAYEVEDSAFAFIQFPQGFSMNLEASYALNSAQEEENTIELFGTKAGALLTDEGITINYVEAGAFVEKTRHMAKGDAGKMETDDYIRAIREDDVPLVKAEEALLNMKILSAIYFSSERKKPVSLADLT